MVNIFSFTFSVGDGENYYGDLKRIMNMASFVSSVGDGEVEGKNNDDDIEGSE